MARPLPGKFMTERKPGRKGRVDMTGHDGIAVTGDYIAIAAKVIRNGKHTARGCSKFREHEPMDIYWFADADPAQEFADAVINNRVT